MMAPLSAGAQVVNNPQHAIGTHLEIAAGDYATIDHTQHVLNASQGGLLTAKGPVRVFSKGIGANGMLAEAAGARIELHDSEIHTTGDVAYGIRLFNGGSALFEHSTINTLGEYATGVYIYGPGGRIDMSGGSIDTLGKEAHGVYLGPGPGSSIAIADTRIRTVGPFAHGIASDYDGNRSTLDRIDVTAEGEYSSAINLSGKNTIAITDSTLRTNGKIAPGLNVREGVVKMARTDVMTSGESGHGLYVFKEYDSPASVDMVDSNIATSGFGAVGAFVRIGARVALERGGIKTGGDKAIGVVTVGKDTTTRIVDGTVATKGARAHGIYASYGGMLDLRNTDVRTEGSEAAVAVVLGSELSLDGGSIVSAQGNAIIANAGVIHATNGARIEGGNGTLLAVDAEDAQPVQLTLDHAASASGNIVNLPTDDGSVTPAVTDLAMSRGAAWQGATQTVNALSMEQGSLWRITGDSTVQSLTLDDSTIAFAPPIGNTHKQLVVQGDYAAHNGKVVLHTTYGDDLSPTDTLVIDAGHASGNTGLIVKRSGGEGAATTIGIPLVETRNGGTTDAKAFVLDAASDGYRQDVGTISAGGYDYMLTRGGRAGHADDWYLVSAAKPVPPEPIEPETVPPSPPTLRAVAPEPDAYLANTDAAILMPIHTLHQREDQTLRTETDGQRLDGAVWLRAEGQSTSFGGRSVSGNGRLIHAGADLLRFEDSRGGSVRIGTMGMYGSNTTWSTRPLWNPNAQRYASATARGSVDGYNVGLYGTWYGNRDILTGPHVDTWLMYGAYHNSVGGSLPGDSYRSRTVAASIEAGYSFGIHSDGNSRFFVEPGAQIVYAHYHAVGHHSPGGYIGVQRSNDVLTRLGVRVHGVTSVTPTQELRPFIEASWWHGPGSHTLTVDGNPFELRLPRDRAEIKVGATGQLTRHLAVSASIGVQSNLANYAVFRGQLAAKYRWK